MADQAAVPAPFAIPPPPAVTFSEFYSDAGNDPYGGDYAAAMLTFRDAATPNTAAELYNIVSSAEEQNSGVYLGLFEDPGYECGLSLTLHGVKKFPLTIGRPTPWDNKAYAFVQDVVATDIQSVELQMDYFDRTRAELYTSIPATVGRTVELWEASPNDELLGPLPEDEANTKQCRTRRLMLVPPKYAPIVINRRLTPRQLWSELAGAIMVAGDLAACSELMIWIVMAGCRADIGTPSSLILPMPHPPLADATLLKHRRALLTRLLPGLSVVSPPGVSDPNTARLADFAGQLIEDRRQARDEASQRQAEAKAPKTVSQFWGEDACFRLCVMCGVSSENDLPALWPALASAGKRDRLVAKRIIHEVACASGSLDHAPIVTPELVKKFINLRFGGTDLDDFTEGIHPFALVVRDHRTHAARALTIPAQNAADDYDLATSGEVATTFADAHRLRTNKVTLPTDFIHARAILAAQDIMNQVLLGGDHPVTQAFGAFLADYKSSEMLYIGRLEPHGPQAPALMLRFVQLHLVNWFRTMRQATTLAPAPDFRSALVSLLVGNTSWVPTIPHRYLEQAAPSKSLSLGSPHVSGACTAAGPTLPPLAAPVKSSAEVHLAKNAAFDKYKANILGKTIKAAITTAGEPPTIKRDGQDRPMCAAYHLKGLCYSTCKRQYDHQPHSPAEDEPLLAWCAVAYS